MGNRANLVAGFTSMMAAYQAANPTLLKRHFRSRPTTLLTDWPCSYLDLRPATVGYMNGLRDTIYSPSIVYVDRPTENGETTDRTDAFVDSFTDFLDGYSHITAGTVWNTGTWNDEAVPLGDETSAAGVRFTFNDITFKNGRT